MRCGKIFVPSSSWIYILDGPRGVFLSRHEIPEQRLLPTRARTLLVCFRGKGLKRAQFSNKIWHLKTNLKIWPHWGPCKNRALYTEAAFFPLDLWCPSTNVYRSSPGKALPNFQFQNETAAGWPAQYVYIYIIVAEYITSNDDITRITRLLLNVNCHLIIFDRTDKAQVYWSWLFFRNLKLCIRNLKKVQPF